MKYRSEKKKAQYVNRRVIVERLLRERPVCEACRLFASREGKTLFVAKPSTDIHEIIRRSQGGSILETDNLLAICRSCHNRIGKSPTEAQQLGLQLPGWATPDMKAEASAIRQKWAKGEACLPSWL